MFNFWELKVPLMFNFWELKVPLISNFWELKGVNASPGELKDDAGHHLTRSR